jgi:hypothetical protein
LKNKSNTYYPASQVKPTRNIVADLLREMKAGQAFNAPIKNRQKYVTTISRLHKKSEGRWKTVKISDSEIAVVRKE